MEKQEGNKMIRSGKTGSCSKQRKHSEKQGYTGEEKTFWTASCCFPDHKIDDILCILADKHKFEKQDIGQTATGTDVT